MASGQLVNPESLEYSDRALLAHDRTILECVERDTGVFRQRIDFCVESGETIWATLDNREPREKKCESDATSRLATTEATIVLPLNTEPVSYLKSTTAYVPIFGSENSIAPSAEVGSTSAALPLPAMYASPL